VIKNVYWCACRLPDVLVRFQWNLNFLDTFSNKHSIQSFTKIHPMGAELFHADGRTHEQTDVMKLIVKKKKKHTVLRMRLKLSEITKFYTSIRSFQMKLEQFGGFLSDGEEDVTIYLTGCRGTHSVVTNGWNNSEKSYFLVTRTTVESRPRSVRQT
jgi:hypothetical protein